MDTAVIDAQTGIVVTVVDTPSPGEYDPGPGFIAVDATGLTAYAGCGWTLADGFSEPGSAPPSKADLIAYTADRRWRVETGGIVVGGVPVATDDRSKIMIIGARVKANANPEFETAWKTAEGFILLDGPTLIAISDAVLAHVDACFAAEAAVLADIEAGTITTTAEIDAAEWPHA